MISVENGVRCRELLRHLIPLNSGLSQQLQPLDRVAIAAPVARLDRFKARVTWAIICGRHVAIQRINLHTAICCQSPDQGRILALTLTPRHTDQRNPEIAFKIPNGRLPKHVQPIADLRFFQLTQIRIQLRQIAILVLARHTHIGVQPGGVGQGQDLAAQAVDAARIDAGCFVVLVHQGFQIAQRSIGLGPGQGRRQVVDDHGLRTALGLCPFAGIVYDERIDMRHRAHHGLGPAGFGQGHGLARQPF